MSKKTKKVIKKAKHIKRTSYNRRKVKEWAEQDIPKDSWVGKRVYPAKEAVYEAGRAVEKEVPGAVKGVVSAPVVEAGKILKGAGGAAKVGYSNVKKPIVDFGWRFQKRSDLYKQRQVQYDAKKQQILEKRDAAKEAAAKTKLDRKIAIMEERKAPGIGNWMRRNVTTKGAETTEEAIESNRAKIKRLRSIKANKGKIDVEHVRFRDKLMLRDVKRLSAPELNKLSDEELVSYNKIVKRRETLDQLKAGKIGQFRRKWLSPTKTPYHAGKLATDVAGKGILRGGQAFGKIGGAMQESAAASIGPIQIFSLAWTKMSNVIKILVALVFFVVIAFVPIGVFFYAGWAVAAGFMFLVSLIYWVFINIFNGIAYVLVSVINGIITIILQIVIVIVETILGFLKSQGTMIVPNPKWAAHFKSGLAVDGITTTTDPWQSKAFSDALADLRTGGDISLQGVAIQEPNSYWYAGNLLLESSLISYDQIANVPSLMFVVAPAWQDAYNETILSVILRAFGITDIANAFRDIILGIGFTGAMKTFVNTSPPWLIILVGLLPIIAVMAIIYWWYRKTKNDPNLQLK